MTSSGPEQPPDGPSATGTGVDLGRLRPADHAVAAGTLLYLIFMLIPWFSIDGFDLGSGYRIPGISVNGFDSGVLTVAFLLLLVASAWTLLPAFVDVPVPFPRAVITLVLAAPAAVLTLIEWLTTLDIGFTLMGLLTFLSSVAVLAVAALRLLPELRDGRSLPGGPAGHGDAGPPPGSEQPPYGRPPEGS
jgi:hypothetical protein